jgi:hypothetical protein
VSPLFDRVKPGVAKMQCGFFDFIALPMVANFCAVFKGAQPLLDAMRDNYRSVGVVG